MSEITLFKGVVHLKKTKKTFVDNNSKVHYMENNPGMFSSKTLISFRPNKERHGHLG